MIYFDNAATSYPKPDAVKNAVLEAVRCAGNPGRSLHEPARWSTEKLMEVRKKAAALFHIKDPLQISFVHNATHALNSAIHMCKGKILTTSMEHNSVLRPCYKKGYYDIVYADPKGNLTPERILSAVTPTTGAIVMTHASNVVGTVYDIGSVGAYCRKNGILLIVDGSQTAGVCEIDVESMNIDILCFTGHKGLFGLQGTGGIYISPEIRAAPFMLGGTGIKSLDPKHPEEMPECFEAGTVNTHGIASLGAGIDFVMSVGLQNIAAHEKKLKQSLYRLLIKEPGITVYGDPEAESTGILAFNIAGIESSVVSDRLAKQGICVRGGYHCAPLAHKTIGTYDSGAVRVSFNIFNTQEEVEQFVQILRKIK